MAAWPIGSRAGMAVTLAAFSMLAWTASGEKPSPVSDAPARAPGPEPAPPASPSATVTMRPAPPAPGAPQLDCSGFCGFRRGGAPPYKVIDAATDADCCEACSSDGMCEVWVRDNRTSMCALKAARESELVADGNFTTGQPSTRELMGDSPNIALSCNARNTTCLTGCMAVAVDSEAPGSGGGGGFPCASSGGQVFRGPTISGGGQTGSAGACCNACQRRSGCFLWSWRRGDGMCFLRSRWGGVGRNGNFVSGSLF